MDGLTLLRRAREAGLKIQPAGDMLKITGPKRAEPLVRLLAKHKADVLAALAWAAEAQWWRERFCFGRRWRGDADAALAGVGLRTRFWQLADEHE